MCTRVQFGRTWADLPAPVHQYIGSIVGGEKTAEGEVFSGRYDMRQGGCMGPDTRFLHHFHAVQCSAAYALQAATHRLSTTLKRFQMT